MFEPEARVVPGPFIEANCLATRDTFDAGRRDVRCPFVRL
jgi:hypothetical protein